MMHHLSVYRFSLVFLLALIFIELGCARKVTSKDTILNLEIRIEFQSNVDLNNNYYYMAFSGNSIPLVPTQNRPPNEAEYFLTPGRVYDASNDFLFVFDRDVNYFYKNFFLTWSDYIVCYKDDDNNSNVARLYKSEVASFDRTTSGNEHYKYTYADKFEYELRIEDANSIVLVCQIQDFSVVPSILYFNFFTCKKNVKSHIANDETGYLQDILVESADIASIAVEFGADTERRLELQNFALESNKGADIRAWRVRLR